MRLMCINDICPLRKRCGRYTQDPQIGDQNEWLRPLADDEGNVYCNYEKSIEEQPAKGQDQTGSESVQ